MLSLNMLPTIVGQLLFVRGKASDGHMKYHEMKEKEVEQALNTNVSTGLSEKFSGE